MSGKWLVLLALAGGVLLARDAAVSFQAPLGGSGAMTPGKPVSLLEGAVLVDLVPTTERISEPAFQSDFAALLAGPEGELWAAWVAYANGRNQVQVRRYNGSAWGEMETISRDHDDIFIVKTARDEDGGVWFVWSSRVDGAFDLYGRRIMAGEWSAIERLTEEPQPDIFPAMTTDSKGRMWLVWQGFRRGNANIFARYYKKGEWSGEQQISLSAANDWEPVVAADSKGRVYAAWDTYDKGNYDVVMSRFAKGEWGDREVIAGTPRFEAHVSLACDGKNRLWAAWNESGANWGKDTGPGVERQGTRLYESRQMAVAVLAKGKWKEPEAALGQSLPEEHQGYNDLPVLQPDTWGRIWLLFRHRLPAVADAPGGAPMDRAGWEIFATTYAGASWTEPLALPSSVGGNDMRIGAAADDDGNVYVAWPTNNRDFERFRPSRTAIHAARLPSFGRRKLWEPHLRERQPEEIEAKPLHRNEASRVSRIRGYRIESGDKTYRIYRGETNRVTELSAEGHNGGSLLDAYRYALDAADLDFLAVREGGNGSEYSIWLRQQMCRVMMISGKFLPLCGYERSADYPGAPGTASDPLSTHISYDCIIAENHSREGLLNAIRKRRAYAATDNIILDYRLRDRDDEYLQGEAVTVSRRFKLWVRVLGTAPVSRIDVIRNTATVHTLEPKEAAVEFTFTDSAAGAEESYYYVRVEQEDGQTAWSSPIWVTIR